MDVKKVSTNSFNTKTSYLTKKRVAFTATPEQLLNAISTSKICSGEKKFLTELASKFIAIRSELPASSIYHLGQYNNAPKSLYGKQAINTWVKINESLAFKNFERTCINCACKSHENAGNFVRRILTSIGAPEPGIITLENKI